MEIIKLREDYIKLGQALKATGLAESGVEAKYAAQDGLVSVNGETVYQRGKNWWTVMWSPIRVKPLKSLSSRLAGKSMIIESIELKNYRKLQRTTYGV